ncbi:acyl-CoA synthetase short-chain family member 3, mitochondrial [Anastrepha obliqua]|uniref:acyl-CoA synthetase short-chain family member 3, mitochondrial n=1 Tax=Anastrepha ludens TaxID=28586 RepID=UPI0023B0C790|nr:acyl-CoA synthetase short-chain family member 3, mitochondrial [Anastrepha ludens]XP_054746979.1 acyl-CoA synthetase short-chain family member 3, mitochondrial [Anastrepha obliqua]
MAGQKGSNSSCNVVKNELLGDSHDPVYVDTYNRSISNPSEFWGELGRLVDWSKPWERVMDNSNPPFTKWYSGGYLNACYNAVDRHVLNGNGSKVALIYDSPLTNTVRHVTYQELYDQVTVFAGGLVSLGLQKGDRVVIYMPLIPESIVAMLATVRLGAIHSVVFGGFAASELCTRIEHAEPKFILSANCGVEPGKVVPYLDILHDAVEMSNWKPVCNIIYIRDNILRSSNLNWKTDMLWETVLHLGAPVDCVPVEANEPLYILYTSGTTDKPKGVQRPTGGHLVSLIYTIQKIYGIKPGDVWWGASDLGWVVGHSYICYGPLSLGATSVMYEGKPDRTPDPGQYFRIIEQHRVNALFSVPTAFRVIRRADPEVKYGQKYSLKSLRSIFIAGEHCDMETKSWMERVFKVPILNHWWQTESGSPVTSTCIGFGHSLNPPKYTTGLPFIGYNVKVLKPDGQECETSKLGRIALKLPLPPGFMSTLYKNDELFKKIYFQKYPGYYDTMDAGYKDENDYVYVTARDDDVINVAGHRISTSSLEDAVLRHPDVVDAAVFGVPEPTKGQVPLCLYIPKEDTRKTEAKLSTEIIKIIRDVVGPIAAFRLVAPVEALPRTRSGKTMRKAMADFAKNELIHLPSTIEDPYVFGGLRRALQTLGYAMNAPDPALSIKN